MLSLVFWRERQAPAENGEEQFRRPDAKEVALEILCFAAWVGMIALLVWVFPEGVSK